MSRGLVIVPSTSPAREATFAAQSAYALCITEAAVPPQTHAGPMNRFQRRKRRDRYHRERTNRRRAWGRGLGLGLPLARVRILRVRAVCSIRPLHCLLCASRCLWCCWKCGIRSTRATDSVRLRRARHCPLGTCCRAPLPFQRYPISAVTVHESKPEAVAGSQFCWPVSLEAYPAYFAVRGSL